MSSSEYLKKMNKCNEIKEKIGKLKITLEDCIDSVNLSKEKADNVIVNGDTIDKGDLKKISTILEQARTAFTIIIENCGEQAEEYKRQYYKALEAEEYARKKIAAVKGSKKIKNERMMNK